MYHWTPIERLHKILTGGLVVGSKRHMGRFIDGCNDKIFLTQYPSWILYYHGFYDKTNCLLKIDIGGLDIKNLHYQYRNTRPWFEHCVYHDIEPNRIKHIFTKT